MSESRVVLVKPGDLLVFGNVGQLDPDTIPDLEPVKAALGLAGIWFFAEDVAMYGSHADHNRSHPRKWSRTGPRAARDPLAGISRDTREPERRLKRDAAIWVSPNRQSGQPCLMGTRMPTESVANFVWMGGFDYALTAYPHLTRWQVIEACWFEGINGRKKWRKRWGKWARHRTWSWLSDPVEVPEPPTSDPGRPSPATDEPQGREAAKWARAWEANRLRPTPAADPDTTPDEREGHR